MASDHASGSTIWQAIPHTRSSLGESPFWHPEQQSLYWVDIEGCAICCLRADGQVERWPTPCEPGCIAPARNGDLIAALRDGVYRFRPASGSFTLLVSAPCDTKLFRFNDGRCDATGRFLAGTISEAKIQRDARLYALEPVPSSTGQDWQLVARADDVMTANGLAFSADARQAWWADTRAHRIDAFDYDQTQGLLTNRRPFKQFEPRPANGDLTAYRGRPDGAAVDEAGAYWCAMYEGGRVLRILPDGQVEREILVPAQCPTMVCFGGSDMRTLFVTTASAGRPDDELSTLPDSGCVFSTRVEIAGLPVNFFDG